MANDQDIATIIALLREIRDGQRLQLERQAEALQRQAEVLAEQRERLARQADSAQVLHNRADDVLARSAQVVSGSRVLLLIAAPVAVLFLVFVCWLVFARPGA